MDLCVGPHTLKNESGFMPPPFCFHYYSSVVQLEIWNSDFSSRFMCVCGGGVLFRIFFVILGLLYFHMKLKVLKNFFEQCEELY